MYRIYRLVCTISGKPRYIGYTYKPLKKRLTEHCTASKLKPNTHKNNWVKSLLVVGHTPKIELVEDGIESLENALDREIFYIKKYKEGGNDLTNSTDGGEGHLNHSHNRETIQRILELKRFRGTTKHSKETIEKIRRSKVGMKPDMRLISKLAEINRRPIIQFDINGNIIGQFSGIRVAARSCNVSHCGILRWINTQHTYKNFLWRYAS